MIPHNRLTHGEKEIEAIKEVVKSGQWAGGKRVSTLEDRLADMFSVKGAVALSSGLSALRLALIGFGVELATPVILPGYSCVALANAVLSLGATPVPVDSSVGDVNPSPTEILRKARRVGASLVVVVHTFGQPVDLAPLQDAGLTVIEDCSHGMPWNPNGSPKPLRGAAAIFSFYATKLIGGGEGGAVLSNNIEVLHRVRDFRDYTDKVPNGLRLNEKLSDLEATLAESQLRRLPSLVEARLERAVRYSNKLAEMLSVDEGVTLPPERPDRIWYRYTVRVPNVSLARVMSRMLESGVQTARPIALWSDRAVCPAAHRAESEILSLPLYPTLDDEEQDKVCSAFSESLA